MIDAALLKRHGWSDELIEAAEKVAEDTFRGAFDGEEVELIETAEVVVETAREIDLTMSPQQSVWPTFTR